MKRLFNYLISTTWGLYIIRLFLTEEQNKKLSIEMLRSNFSLFGYDLSDMTDQEIGVIWFSPFTPGLKTM